MTKSDFVETLIQASKDVLDRDAADDCITAIFNKITKALLGNETVKLHGLGSFNLFKGSPRLCRDVVRGIPIQVPAKTRLKFTPSSILKKRLSKLDAEI